MRIKGKQKVRKKLFMTFLLLFSILFSIGEKEEYKAASSYTNAKEFYESVDYQKKTEVYGGDFYLATMAKLATSSTSLKYKTLGFDITMAGNDTSVSFSVALGDSMQHLEDATVNFGEYQYNLYKIPAQTLYNLATVKNYYAAMQLLSGASITVTANAIITTKQYGKDHGYITENGAGDVYGSGTVYHLGNGFELGYAQRIFGNAFGSYINIEGEIKNTNLSILYSIGNGATVAKGYGSGTYAGYSNVLYNAYGVHIDNYRLMQQFYLVNPQTIGLSKPGYYLPKEKEWITSTGQTFSASKIYMPKTINPTVAYENAGTVLYANWKANTYYIEYDSNGGEGHVVPSSMIYDKAAKLQNCTFTRRGYSLVEGAEWNTKPDGTGKSYSSGEEVKRLGEKNGETVKLYAQWTPNTYEITTDQGSGRGGTSVFYEKYNKGWYWDQETMSPTEKIEIPLRVGYDFLGYLPNVYGAGETIVDHKGDIIIGSNFFAEHSIIYATYEPKEYTISFEKNEGIGGSDTVIATFDNYLPYAQAPSKNGYSFKGYYGETDYSGEIWYLETMGANLRYTVPYDVTLYAKWVDDISPYARIKVDTTNWTNKASGITVTAYASDSGSGLNKVELYCGNELVLDKTDLGGTKELVTLEWVHSTEGAHRYRVVAYDVDGNASDRYEYVKYDMKPPTGELNVTNPDLDNFGVDVDAKDYNIQ